MFFTVRHWTRYDYSVPVSLGPHWVRMVPQGSNVRVDTHRLVVDPSPTERAPHLDPHGNQIVRLNFQGQTSTFAVESQIEAFVFTPSPWPNQGFSRLPWVLPSPSPLFSAVDATVHDFAHGLAQRTGYELGAFLHELTQELFQRTDRRVRLDGDAQPAAETLASRVGACRDLTVLFLDCCRALGIEGRFVSGYQASADTPDGRRYLHAWAEVKVPGLGWRGFDPTHGMPVGDGHLPLCSAPTQQETMPVEGAYSFQGPSLSSTLSFDVTISTRS